MKKNLLVLFFLTLCEITNAQLLDGLVACYDFNGNANDETGNGYNGTVYNATLTTDRFGNPNNSYNFNGSSSYITLPTSNLNMRQYSYSVWVCLNSLPTSNNRYWVLSIGNITGDQFLNYNTYSFGHGWGSGGYNSTAPNGFIYDNKTAFINQWYHLVVTRSATESKFYINGVFVDSETVKSNNFPFYGLGTLNAKIGIRFDNSDPFDGKIDDLRIYNRPLTIVEIGNLYSKKTNCSNQSGVISSNDFEFIYEKSLLKNNIQLYPNPFISQTILESNELFFNATLTVFNCNGETVKQIKNASGQKIILHRNNLPSGMYYIQITQDNKIIASDKIVITD